MTALVDAALYRRVTQDTTSSDPDVTLALDDTQQLVAEHCHRILDFGTYTETLLVSPNGVVYPKARPLASVSVPDGATLRAGGIHVGYVPGVIPGRIDGPPEREVTVTYTGGFQPYNATTGPTDPLPMKLARVICRIAWYMLHPVTLPGVPAGVKSIANGDVSMAGDLSPFIAIDSSIEHDLKGFVLRRARG